MKIITIGYAAAKSGTRRLGAPAIAIGPLYQPKTLELCAPGDPICGGGNDPAAHGAYPVNGMTSQAAGFAASHL